MVRDSSSGPEDDGASVHLSEKDHNAYVSDFIKEERRRNPSGQTPECYVTTDGPVFIAEAPLKLFNQVKKSKNGIKIYDKDIKTLRRNV